MNYFLRISIAFDGMVQALLPPWRENRVGGVTISSRVGTAAAHGHPWGLIGARLLTVKHCKAAIKSDRLRAHMVLQELGDPVVQNWLRRK